MQMSSPSIVIVGGGAAGFFAAITCAEATPRADVTILEKTAQFLGKVRISGGGRCNVTHACFEPPALATRYPRGERALLAPYQIFQARDTVAWFESRGVKLKTERDGRMFPITDSSQTIIDCLTRSAANAGVKLVPNCGVNHIAQTPSGQFALTFSTGETRHCDRLLLATGGCRAAAAELPVSLGHTIAPPVPSLFTFHIDTAWVRELSGVAVEPVSVSVPKTGLRERGPLLLTHWGLSGPVILRLSAWGARVLNKLDYHFPLLINWLPDLDDDKIAQELTARRQQHPARCVVNTPIAGLPARLWEKLVLATGVSSETRWADFSSAARHTLIQQLTRTELAVTGKSLNKDEFVTCGGVRLSEVDFKTMQSRLCPGLYFAGELLDIDGITGGFNFQSAWTTGWIAGQAMAKAKATAED
jgi:predicted Rossmann fold flavoprotein